MFTIRGRRPKTCLDCPCVHFGERGAWDYCQAKPREDKYSFQSEKQTERPKWCPIEKKEEDDGEKIKLELREDTLQFYLRMIARHLDNHPDQELVTYTHMVDGEWTHELRIQQKKIGEFRK